MKPVTQRVLKHVTTTPEGCWLWHGALSGVTPVLRVQGRVVSVRRAISNIESPRLTTTCGHSACVAPDHITDRQDLKFRIRQLVVGLHDDECWVVDPKNQPTLLVNGHQTTARRAAYSAFIGDPGRERLRMKCRRHACFNPWHVIEPIKVQPSHVEELDEIEDCICFILEWPHKPPPYDQPTIDAARRRIEEEGL